MKRFLPVIKAAHQSEGNVYKNTGSLKTVKSSLTTNFTFVLFVMFPMNIYVLLPTSGKKLVQTGI